MHGTSHMSYSIHISFINVRKIERGFMFTMFSMISIVQCFCIIIILLAGDHGHSVEAGKQQRLVVDGELDLYEEVVKLKEEVARLTASSGSTYVRWGRTTCPGNGTTRTYEGFMAGTSNSRVGAPANYLCLPSDPNWDYYEDDLQDGILITGVQYEFWPHFGENVTKFFGADIRNAEAPCSVCHTTRSATIMVPGRKDCYTGWTKEYSGYLVGGFPGYNDGSEYVCLDRRPESVPHSGSRDQENMLYFVEGSCGKNLACPPYVHGRELSCAVCSI